VEWGCDGARGAERQSGVIEVTCRRRQPAGVERGCAVDAVLSRSNRGQWV
jgi:hypothetical protein